MGRLKRPQMSKRAMLLYRREHMKKVLWRQKQKKLRELLHESAPDDKSLIIKLQPPDEDVTSTEQECEHLHETASDDKSLICIEHDAISQPDPMRCADEDNSESESETSEDEDPDYFASGHYISRPDMVLRMNNINNTELAAYAESCAEEFGVKFKEYNFKEEHDPECLLEFLFFDLPTPPISPELKKTFFSENIGPIKQFCVYEAFTTIWNGPIMDRIAREINENAKRSKKSVWVKTDAYELFLFFALTLATSNIRNVEKYWDCPVNYSQAMTYKRFKALNTYLFFSAPNNNECSKAEAKLSNIKPLIDHLNKRFSDLYQPSQDIIFDEPSTVCKIYNRYAVLKNKCGLKEINASDAKTGYIWKLDILAEKSDSKMTRGIPPCFILNNIKELEGKGYTIWTDNIFNRLLFARTLKMLRFNVVGTLRIKDVVLKEYSQPNRYKLKYGEVSGCTSGDLDIVVWRNQKLITFLSSYHGKTVTKENGMVIPAVFVDYKNNVASLDKRDLILADYSEGVKGKSWLHHMFIRLLNISVYNSFVLHNYDDRFTAGRFEVFRVQLIYELATRHGVTNTMPEIKVEIP